MQGARLNITSPSYSHLHIPEVRAAVLPGKLLCLKGGPTVEADPTWVTLGFLRLDSTITVIRFLLSILDSTEEVDVLG